MSFPKPEPRIVLKKRQKLDEALRERLCRAAVKLRDRNHCVVPGCKERGEMHHIVYRSRSKRLKWESGNNCILCRAHHALLHAGKIQIAGDANEHLTITGKREYLAFKL